MHKGGFGRRAHGGSGQERRAHSGSNQRAWRRLQQRSTEGAPAVEGLRHYDSRGALTCSSKGALAWSAVWLRQRCTWRMLR